LKGECQTVLVSRCKEKLEGLAEVVYDILHYRGNLVIEEIVIQAIDPD